jgi:hypothetical protein
VQGGEQIFIRQRDFAVVQGELEETMSKLRITVDKSVRQQLLREMRYLLEEADSTLKSKDQSQ